MISKFDRILDRIDERFGLLAAALTLLVVGLAAAMMVTAAMILVGVMLTLLPSWLSISIVIGSVASILALIIYFIAVTWRD